MVGSNGDPVAHAYVSGALSQGNGSLTLRFDGKNISASQLCGPYTLTNLLQLDQNGATLVVEQAFDVYETAAYDYRAIGVNPVFLPIVVRR